MIYAPAAPGWFWIHYHCIDLLMPFRTYLNDLCARGAGLAPDLLLLHELPGAISDLLKEFMLPWPGAGPGLIIA